MSSIPEIVQGLSRLRALVVGDICLDRWCRYDPAFGDVSRETGLTRVAVTSVERTPGAGGTVANNLAAFGLSRVSVLGLIGDDGHGTELIRALEQRGIETAFLIKSGEIATFTYTKLINAESRVEDLPRIDFINAVAMPEDLDRKVCTLFNQIQHDFDVIFVVDQAETDQGSVVTAAVRQALTSLAAERPQAVLWADSRQRAEQFRGLTMKVNRSEADAAAMRIFGRSDDIALGQHMRAKALFVTDGARGTAVCQAGAVMHVNSIGVANPVDICGAGDSFSAGAGCALALGADAETAAKFGNIVASITITKQGTGTASPTEILEREGVQTA